VAPELQNGERARGGGGGTSRGSIAEVCDRMGAHAVLLRAAPLEKYFGLGPSVGPGPFTLFFFRGVKFPTGM
jgi:hypothetical protein